MLSRRGDPADHMGQRGEQGRFAWHQDQRTGKTAHATLAGDVMPLVFRREGRGLQPNQETQQEKESGNPGKGHSPPIPSANWPSGAMLSRPLSALGRPGGKRCKDLLAPVATLRYMER